MIPESLRLRNFLSHRETDLDLRGVHLASLVGQNGAGKSALLDAITWAVWGRSRAPYGHDDDLVYHGESSLEVEYVFRMPYQTGAEHRCRILRRREERGRRAVSSLLDFEVETDAGWRVLTSDSIRETQQSIIDHLGLDYDTFINSAYLRQGHADEFTVQSPTQRKSVLSTVLGLDQWSEYQDQARVKLSAVQGQLRELDRRLAETEGELARRAEFEAALSQAEVEAAAAEADLADAQQTMDEMTRVREQAMGLQRQVEDLARRRREVEADLKKLLDETEARRDRLARDQSLVAQADAVQARYTAYQDAVAADRGFGLRLAEAARLQEDRARLETEISVAREELNEAVRVLEREESRLDRAIAEERAAVERSLGEFQTQDALLAERFVDETVLAEFRTAEAAVAALATVAEDLERERVTQQENGVEQSRLTERNRQLRDLMNETKIRLDALAEAEADCPLCGQPLTPEHHRRLLSDIEARGTEMGDEFRANRQRLSELDEAQAVLGVRIRGLETQLRARAAREQALARLQQQLEQGETARRRSESLREQMAVLERRIAEQAYAGPERLALAHVSEQKMQLEAKSASSDFAMQARAELSQVLAELAAVGYDADAHAEVQRRISDLEGAEADFRELEKARTGVESESGALARLEIQTAMQRERLAGMVREGADAEAALAELRSQLSGVAAVVERLNGVRQVATAARQRVGAAKQNLAALTTLGQRVVGMRAQRAGLAERIGIYTELRDAFGVNGIPAMIIEHTLPELERDANRMLQQLTSGRMHVRFETQRETKDRRPAGDPRYHHQ